MMYYLYIMFTGAQKVIPAPNSNAKCPPPSNAYITTLCEYICKRATPENKMRPNPISKPAKKQHEDMFIFWT
jgi:hypothetical protein